MSYRLSTSLHVFRSHIIRLENGDLDVSGVLSRDCYEAWLNSKAAIDCMKEARKFHRTLTNHVSGVGFSFPINAQD